jgi:predicted Rossmann fold flavoprotein
VKASKYVVSRQLYATMAFVKNIQMKANNKAIKAVDKNVAMNKLSHEDAEAFDVLVIGGGPSGMMAAAKAAEQGAKVLLVEKNDSLGKKLLITGGGRCNVTNGETDTRKLLSRFKDADKFLFSAFSQWSVQNTLEFFHMRNMETKEENEKRIFPITNKAQSVWDVLVQELKKNHVTILSNSPVTGFIADESSKTIKGIVLKNKREIHATSIILATGGTSRPETGSTGDGYKWLRKIGHNVIEPEPSLVPVAAKDEWVKRLSGVSLADIKLTTYQNNVKQDMKKGKILFTHVGISGPTVLNMSKDIGELLKYGEVILSLDLLPTLDYGKLNLKLQDIFKENDKKKFKNAFNGLIASAMTPVIVELSGIDPEKQCNSVTREERLSLVQLLKAIPIHVEKLLGEEKAIITSGGVSLDEVDFKTMQSRLYPNLYLIGDILHIDRPSGGYSLQLCWTTGFVAGNHAGKISRT